jgi:hypothetical protein
VMVGERSAVLTASLHQWSEAWHWCTAILLLHCLILEQRKLILIYGYNN